MTKRIEVIRAALGQKDLKDNESYHASGEVCATLHGYECDCVRADIEYLVGVIDRYKKAFG